MTSAQEAPPQAVSAALFESVKIIFMSLKKVKKKTIFYVVVFHRWSLKKNKHSNLIIEMYLKFLSLSIIEKGGIYKRCFYSILLLNWIQNYKKYSCQTITVLLPRMYNYYMIDVRNSTISECPLCVAI